MSQAALSMCDVCGSHAGASGCCDICGTILVEGKVQCRVCGDPLHAYSIVCYSCGSSREATSRSESSREKREAIHHFMLVPGLSEETAGDLYDEGIENFASLVGMALTEPQRTNGLHHVIARRIMLMDVLDTEHEVPVIEEMECPICKSMIDASLESCEICGHYTRIKLDVHEDGLESGLDPLMGKISEKICWDAAFREMPKDFQEELSRVLVEAEDSELEEIEDYVDVFWEELDSDLADLEKGPIEEETAVEEVPRETMMVCPLCEAEVMKNAHFCYNCGARFKEA
ncbi:MAG: hypothetical protein V3U51_03455 [Thermoplasmata archaeon]